MNRFGAKHATDGNDQLDSKTVTNLINQTHTNWQGIWTQGNYLSSDN